MLVARTHDKCCGSGVSVVIMNCRLPTASTCFNTLRLPRYTSEHMLRGRLQVALEGARGFDAGAGAG